MIIFVWIICVLIIAFFVGEIRFQQLKTLKNINKKYNVKEWTDSIDKDIEVLSIESFESKIVPTTKLAMRGSWRLAQDLVMNINDFTELKECEYSKNLQ